MIATDYMAKFKEGPISWLVRKLRGHRVIFEPVNAPMIVFENCVEIRLQDEPSFVTFIGRNGCARLPMSKDDLIVMHEGRLVPIVHVSI